MCNKVDAGIECQECGYPYSEAAYPDDYDDPLPCDASDERIEEHRHYVESLKNSILDHHYDCMCLVCR